MTIYLDEIHVGTDTDTIGFPHLLLCMGLVLVAANRLYGIHLTSVEDTDRAVKAFAKFLKDQKVDVVNASRLYGSSNLKTRYKTNDGKSAWRREMKDIADLIKYSGQAHGFDTSIISPKDGTYVEYQLQLTGDCRIFYKRHEKMNYGDFIHDDNVQKISNVGKLRSDSQVTMHATANVKQTNSNKGQLHEVNYALRLMTTNV